MLIKIIVPINPTVEEADVIEAAAKSKVIAKRLNQYQYTLETEDAENFFWLGMNFNKAVIPE